MDTEPDSANGEIVDPTGPVTDADLARLITKLDEPTTNGRTPSGPTASSVMRICETWPQRVRVARYTDLDSLAAIYIRFHELREDGHLQPGVEFTLENDPGLPRGVRGMLFDPNAGPIHRWSALRLGYYLVHHGDKKLEVVDEHTLHTRYRFLDHEPAPGRPSCAPPNDTNEVTIHSFPCHVCTRVVSAPAPKQRPWTALYAHANLAHGNVFELRRAADETTVEQSGHDGGQSARQDRKGVAP